MRGSKAAGSSGKSRCAIRWIAIASTKRIRHDHLIPARGRGIAIERRLHIRPQQLPRSPAIAAGTRTGCSSASSMRAIRLIEPQALANLLLQPVRDALHAVTRRPLQVIGMDGLLIVEPRKEKLEQILADRRNGPLRGEIGPIDVIDPAAGFIGSEDGIGDFVEAIHLKFGPILYPVRRGIATGENLRPDRKKPRVRKLEDAPGFAGIPRLYRAPSSISQR